MTEELLSIPKITKEPAIRNWQGKGKNSAILAGISAVENRGIQDMNEQPLHFCTNMKYRVALQKK